MGEKQEKIPSEITRLQAQMEQDQKDMHDLMNAWYDESQKSHGDVEVGKALAVKYDALISSAKEKADASFVAFLEALKNRE